MNTFDALGWILKGNEEQHNWIILYLRKANVNFHADQYSPKEQVIKNQLNGMKNDPMGKDFIRRMRNAWNQKKHKSDQLKKNKRTQHTFMLDAKTANQLGKLAKQFKTPKNRTLELLINQVQEGAEKLKEANERHDMSIRSLRFEFDTFYPHIEKKHNELTQDHKILKEQHAQIEKEHADLQLKYRDLKQRIGSMQQSETDRPPVNNDKKTGRKTVKVTRRKKT